MRQEIGGFYIDFHNFIKLIFTYILKRTVERHAGVVNQDVGPAVLLNNTGNTLIKESLIGQIARQHQTVRVLHDQGTGFLQLFQTISAQQDNFHFFLGKLFGGGPAYASSSAG